MMRDCVYFAPSLARLEAVWPGKGQEIRDILHGKVKLKQTYKSVRELCDASYNVPSYEHKVFTALNEVIEGYGVEYLPDTRRPGHTYATYVNTGDVYNTTLLLREDSGCFQLTTWGDVVERNRL